MNVLRTTIDPFVFVLTCPETVITNVSLFSENYNFQKQIQTNSN